jgi:hypothetical protein
MGKVWLSECAAGTFVLGACRHYVVLSRWNYTTAVLRTINLFHEGIS